MITVFFSGDFSCFGERIGDNDRLRRLPNLIKGSKNLNFDITNTKVSLLMIFRYKLKYLMCLRLVLDGDRPFRHSVPLRRLDGDRGRRSTDEPELVRGRERERRTERERRRFGAEWLRLRLFDKFRCRFGDDQRLRPRLRLLPRLRPRLRLRLRLRLRDTRLLDRLRRRDGDRDFLLGERVRDLRPFPFRISISGKRMGEQLRLRRRSGDLKKIKPIKNKVLNSGK